MSYSVWVEIVCEECASTVSGLHTYGNVPRREMTRTAKNYKWDLLDGNWHCPKCLERKKSDG